MLIERLTAELQEVKRELKQTTSELNQTQNEMKLQIIENIQSCTVFEPGMHEFIELPLHGMMGQFEFIELSQGSIQSFWKPAKFWNQWRKAMIKQLQEDNEDLEAELEQVCFAFTPQFREFEPLGESRLV